MHNDEAESGSAYVQQQRKAAAWCWLAVLLCRAMTPVQAGTPACADCDDSLQGQKRRRAAVPRL